MKSRELKIKELKESTWSIKCTIGTKMSASFIYFILVNANSKCIYASNQKQQANIESWYDRYL